MTKADLVEQVAEAIGPGITKRDCALVVDGFLNAVKQALVQGKGIEIRGFGTFKVRFNKARMARNPKTGEPVAVPERSVPVFKPSRLLQERVTEGAVRQAQGHMPPVYGDSGFISFPSRSTSKGRSRARSSAEELGRLPKFQ